MNVKDTKYAFGTQFPTKSSGTCTIIKYENARNIYVMFDFLIAFLVIDCILFFFYLFCF